MKLIHETEHPAKCNAARQRALNIRRDLERAIGAFSVGDQSAMTLKTIALGKIAYDAVGLPVPRPLNVSPDVWPQVLADIVDRYGTLIGCVDQKPAA